MDGPIKGQINVIIIIALAVNSTLGFVICTYYTTKAASHKTVVVAA